MASAPPCPTGAGAAAQARHQGGRDARFPGCGHQWRAPERPRPGRRQHGAAQASKAVWTAASHATGQPDSTAAMPGYAVKLWHAQPCMQYIWVGVVQDWIRLRHLRWPPSLQLPVLQHGARAEQPAAREDGPAGRPAGGHCVRGQGQRAGHCESGGGQAPRGPLTVVLAQQARVAHQLCASSRGRYGFICHVACTPTSPPLLALHPCSTGFTSPVRCAPLPALPVQQGPCAGGAWHVGVPSILQG